MQAEQPPSTVTCARHVAGSACEGRRARVGRVRSRDYQYLVYRSPDTSRVRKVGFVLLTIRGELQSRPSLKIAIWVARDDLQNQLLLGVRVYRHREHRGRGGELVAGAQPAVRHA